LVVHEADHSVHAVEALRWTSSGKVQVRAVRDAGRRLGKVTSVEVMRLDHADGRDALAAALAELPRAAQ
jgi:hypothetical protein